MSGSGSVNVEIDDGVGIITFFHPQGNSLPGALLRDIARAVDDTGIDARVRVIVLTSAGDRAFCGGASFDELMGIEDFDQGREFFMGFSRLILAMRRCPVFIIARVQGKAVGGGVGIVSAADYALATKDASAKLSELALGIGPFAVGPAVERRIGAGPFAAMSIDHDWRDAEWCKIHGLYNEIYDSIAELDMAVHTLAAKLAACSPEAMRELKRVLWEGTDHWEQLIPARAAISGNLVLSDFTRAYIAKFKGK